MGNCCAPEEHAVITQQQSMEEFKKADLNKDNVLTKDELATYIDSHAELWAMLGVNLNLGEERCREIATHVAFSLATTTTTTANSMTSPQKNKQTIPQSTKNKKEEESSPPPPQQQQQKQISLNHEEFHKFREKYVLDPKGNQEFFHRTVFAAFDNDRNGVLDASELDKFLDIFYKADSIFAGDARLPKKEDLRKHVMEKLDTDHNGVLTFEEIRGLISGTAVASTTTPKNN